MDCFFYVILYLNQNLCFLFAFKTIYFLNHCFLIFIIVNLLISCLIILIYFDLSLITI